MKLEKYQLLKRYQAISTFVKQINKKTSLGIHEVRSRGQNLEGEGEVEDEMWVQYVALVK